MGESARSAYARSAFLFFILVVSLYIIKIVVFMFKIESGRRAAERARAVFAFVGESGTKKGWVER